MPRIALTDLAIKNFDTPERGTRTFWDSTIRGFGIRLSAGGAKTFVVLVASGRRSSLGRYPLVSLSEARTEAKRILAEKTLGVIRPTHTAFDDAKAAFLSECGRRNKPRTVNDYRRLISRHFDFGRRSIADITPRELVTNLSKLNATPTEKHHAFTAARAFFRWAMRDHLIEKNPLELVRVLPPNSSRDRVLTPEELCKTLAVALAGSSLFHSIVAVLVLTGQRRGEIAALQWSWIDLREKLITLPPEITKNRRRHQFPIGEMTLGVFERIPRLSGNPYVFPASRQRDKDTPAKMFNGWGKAKVLLDSELGLAPWTLHDLRRTLRTHWAELGVSREVAERYINHVSGIHSGVQAIYNRYSYLAEMRAAVDRWEVHLRRLCSNSVTALRSTIPLVEAS